MARTKFSATHIRGQKIDLYIDGDGKFSAEYDGEEYYAPSLEALTKKLNRATKKPLSIPFYRWEQEYGAKAGKLRHGMIVGLHAANNNVLVKFDGEKGSEQDRAWSNSSFLKLTPDEATKYESMRKAYSALGEQIEEFEESHKFSGRKAAEEAIENLEKKESVK